MPRILSVKRSTSWVWWYERHRTYSASGAEVFDQEVVIDGQLTTSRSPTDLPAFCAAIVEQFAHTRQPAPS